MAAHRPGDPTPSGKSRAETLARLVEAVHEGVYIGILGPEGDRTIAANPHLKVMFGYPPETPETEVRPFDLPRFVDSQARATLVERLTHDGTVSDYLLRLRRADGTPMWVEITGRADVPALDRTFRVEALVRDVSDRRRLEDQARDLYHQLLQAEKLAALGQTVSGVAHELNNPLATILTWAERLTQRRVDDDTRRGLDVILAESERAARIVRSLLTFARKRHTTRSMVDLNSVIRETLALRAYEHRVTNIAVIDALAAGLPLVFADAHQLQQVLLNLVINAEQAMLAANGRGTLVVRTWHDAGREAVVFEVNDDGPGIAPDLKSKVFDPFFTTKDVGKGTGLGLTVAYAIIQEHGGRIWVESRNGGGASFFVQLPTGETETVQPPAGSAPAVKVRNVGATALLVEDEPALAAALAEGLKDAGFVVDRAGDGEEALTRVRGRSYDLIVCDLKMPRVDGIEFYRTIAAANPLLTRRVVFVTGDVVGTEAERFLEETGCRWLAKPFRFADLLRVAEDVLE